MSMGLAKMLEPIAPFMKLARDRKMTVNVAEHPEYAVAMQKAAGKNNAVEG